MQRPAGSYTAPEGTAQQEQSHPSRSIPLHKESLVQQTVRQTGSEKCRASTQVGWALVRGRSRTSRRELTRTGCHQGLELEE
jgi:hypothetical protein